MYSGIRGCYGMFLLPPCQVQFNGSVLEGNHFFNETPSDRRHLRSLDDMQFILTVFPVLTPL